LTVHLIFVIYTHDCTSQNSKDMAISDTTFYYILKLSNKRGGAKALMPSLNKNT